MQGVTIFNNYNNSLKPRATPDISSCKCIMGRAKIFGDSWPYVSLLVIGHNFFPKIWDKI